ncbi:amidase-like [Liolophura sinensis]|uniref:amidase-like n=1 Tax=Liolophura sinensis TaxID=3198878 RepID=UPI003159214E
MAVRPISKDIVLSKAKSLNIPCYEQEAEKITECINVILRSYERLDEIVEVVPEVKYGRTCGHRPTTDQNPYNAWYYKCDIKGAATGKLSGKRVGIKDNTAVAGVPMMNGSKIMEGYVPEFDATVVTRVLDAGGHIVGKAACDDMCFDAGGFTNSIAPVLNPVDKRHLAGGSSSGCAALLAAGEVDLAVGGDQGGSIRIPAAWCGVVGLKPTYGLVPYTGAMAMLPCIDHLGPMTRNVSDCALLLEVLAGYDDGRDPRQIQDVSTQDYTAILSKDLTGMRIAVVEEGFHGAQQEVEQVVRNAALKLKDLGAVVESVRVPIHPDGFHIFTPLTMEGAYQTMMKDHGFPAGLRGTRFLSLLDEVAHRQTSRPFNFSEPLRLAMILGKHLMTTYKGRFYARAQNLVRLLTAEYNKVLESYDVMIMPTTLKTAPNVLLQDSSVAERLTAGSGLGRNTAPFNATGHPSLSVNAGHVGGGLPVGMMITGRHFDDATVLHVAYAFEHIRDNPTFTSI